MLQLHKCFIHSSQGHTAEADNLAPKGQSLGHQGYYSFYYTHGLQFDFHCETLRAPLLQMDTYKCKHYKYVIFKSTHGKYQISPSSNINSILPTKYQYFTFVKVL